MWSVTAPCRSGLAGRCTTSSGAALAGSARSTTHSLSQARELGVEVRFGCAAAAKDVQIFAAGPQGRPMAVVRGLTFATPHEDLACLLLLGGPQQR